MARRAAGPAGPLHSAQDPAPGDVDPLGAGDHESLERLRASLLHGRTARTAALRVEDPVHPPTGSDAGWPDAGWPGAGRAQDRPDEAADPDGLAGGESAVMHPDDLAALHALPTTTAETRAWAGPDAQDRGRLVGAAPGLSLWEDDPSWDGGRSWDDEASWSDEPADGLLRQRWLQLTLCALLALVVGASLALLLANHQVDAARAEADLARQAASTAQAALVRERAARASGQDGAPAAPPAPAAPTDEPAQAPGVDPAAVAPPPLSDQDRPPVAESPAPTADPGPPPPGPSPAPAAPPRARSSTTSSPTGPPAQDDAASDDTGSDGAAPGDEGPDQDASASTSQTCAQATAGAEGGSPGTCP